MNEISNDTSSDSSVTSVFSTNCSLISSILAFVIIGMILSCVHSGNEPTGASTLTITSLYISCHVIFVSFNSSHIWANSSALCAAISSSISLTVSIADHVNTSHVPVCHSERSEESSPLHACTSPVITPSSLCDTPPVRGVIWSPVKGLFCSLLGELSVGLRGCCTSHVPFCHSCTFSASLAFISSITSSNSPSKIPSKLSKRKSLIFSFCSAVHLYSSSIPANSA